jgi:hypothetical protein
MVLVSIKFYKRLEKDVNSVPPQLDFVNLRFSAVVLLSACRLCFYLVELFAI